MKSEFLRKIIVVTARVFGSFNLAETWKLYYKSTTHQLQGQS